jgi:hypothetical protein
MFVEELSSQSDKYGTDQNNFLSNFITLPRIICTFEKSFSLCKYFFQFNQFKLRPFYECEIEPWENIFQSIQLYTKYH